MQGTKQKIPPYYVKEGGYAIKEGGVTMLKKKPPLC